MPNHLVREDAGVQQGMHTPQPFPAGISGDPAPATRQAATGINRQAGGRTDIFSGPRQAQLSPLAAPLLLKPRHLDVFGRYRIHWVRGTH
jgi:hypothetical protein